MRSLLSLWLRKWPLWGISSWATEVEKHLCQALKGSMCACFSSSPKCLFCTHPALYPACQMAPPGLGRNLPSSPLSLTLGEALAELVEGERLNGMRMEMKRRGSLLERGEGRRAWRILQLRHAPLLQGRGWNTLGDMWLALK